MAEVKAVPKPVEAPDPWKSDKSNWEYIAIPEENALGFPHDSIGNNRHDFKAGQTYLVPPEVAADVRERLKVYAKAVIRTLQPNRDMKAVSQVPVGGAGAVNTNPDSF